MKKMAILISVISFSALAKPEHRHHEAHVHGSATLEIAFDNLVGKAEFKSPADSIVGFEYEAKSEKDKKRISEAMSKFENEMSKMIQLESSLGCQFTKDSVSLEREPGENHADFVATFHINCKKPIKGSKVKIDFTNFSRIKDLDVTFLVDSLQKSLEVKGKPLSIELK